VFTNTGNIAALVTTSRANRNTACLDGAAVPTRVAGVRPGDRFILAQGRLLQTHVDALRIELLAAGQLIQLAQDARAELRGFARALDAEAIAAIADVYAEALRDLPQVLVKLAAEIREDLVVNRFKKNFLGLSCGSQATCAGAGRRPRNEFGNASEIRTSTNWPIKRSAPSKLTQRLFSVRPASCSGFLRA